ncbi:MAG: adenine phosphoribosyltransferase [Planctomycetota bacterium]|nr:adenine phosphoribosyltransferase [Planctomycetota bacterium]
MPASSPSDLQSLIRNIPDYPKPGILFRDISPLLANPTGFSDAIRQLAEPYRDQQIDLIAGAEARGFILAAPLAVELGAGFVPIRKPAKLPFQTHSIDYQLEYGTDSLEIHVDGVKPGQRVLLVDDLLATGGTAEACSQLLTQLGAELIGCAFLVHLEGLGGADRLAPLEIFSLINYNEST